MREVEREGDSVYLRGESDYERYGLKLTAAPDAGVGHIGLRTRSAEALERRVSDLRGAGVDGTWTDGDHGHGPSFRFRDPDGHVLELYWETRALPGRPRATRRCRATGSAVVAAPASRRRRLDHVSLLAADVQPAAASCLAVARRRAARRGARGRRLGERRWLSFGQRPLELVYTRDRAAAPRSAAPRGLLGRHARGGAARGRHLRRPRGPDRGATRPAHDRAQLLPLRVRARRQPHRDHHRRRPRARSRSADPDAGPQPSAAGGSAGAPCSRSSWTDYGTPGREDSRRGRSPGFAGAVPGPDDPGYDEARAVWNRDARPPSRAVARRTSATDVAAGDRLRPCNTTWPIAVRGGGHSLPGHSTVDGGIVIDLRSL